MMVAFQRLLERLRREDGAAMAEYAVIVAVVVVGAVAAIALIGDGISEALNDVKNTLIGVDAD